MPYSVSQEDLEDTITTALEKQFADTRPRLNPAMDVLNKRTEYVLGIYYREISKRKEKSTISQNKRGL